FFSLFFTPTVPSPFSTLSLHDALPISVGGRLVDGHNAADLQRLRGTVGGSALRFSQYFKLRLDNLQPATAPGAVLYLAVERHQRSEEHTSELQSPYDLVCRLLLEKKKK